MRGAVPVQAAVDVLDFPAEVSQARLAGRPVERGAPVAPVEIPPVGVEPAGEIAFVRVEFAGGRAGGAAPALLLEGLDATFVAENVQAHASAGNGIEMRDGSAGCFCCVASDSGGTGLAWSAGWTGIAQHLYVRQGSRGQAAGDTGAVPDGPAAPRSEPVLSNATLTGAGWQQTGIGSTVGLLLRSDTVLTVRNAVIAGFGGTAVDIRGRSLEHFQTGAARVEGLLLHTNRQGAGELPPWIGASEADSLERNPRRNGNPDPRPRRDSAALAAGVAAKETDPRAILDGDHVGAFGTRNWLEGWMFLGPETDYAPK